MLKLEVLEDIQFHQMCIHRGTIINIASGSKLVTCEGLVTGLPEGAAPLLTVDDLKGDSFKGKFKVMRTKAALLAQAKVLYKKAKDKIS